LGARGILFNISGGKNMSMTEVNEAAGIISAKADPDANIIFGATIREDLGEEIKISVIATGFDEGRRRMQSFVSGLNSDYFNAKPGEETAEEEVADGKDGLVDGTPSPALAAAEDARTAHNIRHQEVQIDDDLDIPTFLRKK